MTKKHFEAVASAIRAEYEDTYGEPAEEAIRSIARKLADVFASENPRFDRARFLAACGITA